LRARHRGVVVKKWGTPVFHPKQSTQSTLRNDRNGRNARIDTASILAFWPLRCLRQLRSLRTLLRSLRALRALCWTETRFKCMLKAKLCLNFFCTFVRFVLKLQSMYEDAIKLTLVVNFLSYINCLTIITNKNYRVTERQKTRPASTPMARHKWRWYSDVMPTIFTLGTDVRFKPHSARTGTGFTTFGCSCAS